MKAIETRDALLSSNVGEDGLKISDRWYKECLNELDQLEADAELGRAVRLAFYKKKFYMKETGMLKTGIVIETEKELIEWAKEVK